MFTYNGLLILFVSLILASVILGCTKSIEQTIVIPDVTKTYETVVHLENNSSFPFNKTHRAKCTLRGRVSGNFKIEFSEFQNPNLDKNQSIHSTRLFTQLNEMDEFETEWYGAPMKITYLPSNQISDGNLSLTITFYAIE